MASAVPQQGGMNYKWKREHSNRVYHRPRNALADPLAHVKEPLRHEWRGKAKIEFSPEDVRMIRAKFRATQQEFAELIGIKWETLRNWEEGRRRPHGPARALLRAIDADPVMLAKVLNWHSREFKPEPDDWLVE